MTILERLLKLEKQMNMMYCKMRDTQTPLDIPPHNELEGLDGGDENGYFHLTQEQLEGLNEGLDGGFNPLTSEFLVTKGAGRFDSGEIFPGGKTLSQAFQLLLTDTHFPTLIPPTFTITSNMGIREVGETFNLILTGNFFRGQIKGNVVNNIWDFNAIQNSRSGSPTSYTINNEVFNTSALNQDKVLTNFVTPINSTTFNGDVSYGVGPQPKDSEGLNFDAPLASGVLSNSITVVGYQRRYSGSINSYPTNGGEIRTKLINGSVLNTPNLFSFTTGTNNKIFIIAIPNNKTLVSAINFGTNENLTSGFVLSGINTIPDAGGTNRPYKIYIMENAVPFSNNYTINVTLS